MLKGFLVGGNEQVAGFLDYLSALGSVMRILREAGWVLRAARTSPAKNLPNR